MKNPKKYLNSLILVVVRMGIFFLVSIFTFSVFLGGYYISKDKFDEAKTENANLEEKINKLNNTLTEQNSIFKSPEYISYDKRINEEAKAIIEKAAAEKAVADKVAAEKAAADKIVAQKLAETKAAAEKIAKEKAEKLRGFTQTINKLDPIIKLLDDLHSGFLDTENWYEGNPIISSNVQSSLNKLESTDTKPLGAILVIREQYVLAEKLAKLSMNINEITPNLTKMVRVSYFPTPSSNWKGDIQKAKQLLNTAKGYTNTYRTLKSQVDRGNIY